MGFSGLAGIWRESFEQSINTEVRAARHICSGSTDESQASNDKQIRQGYMEMEPADAVADCLQT